MSFVIISGQPDLLDKSQNPSAIIGMVLNPTNNLYYSDQYFLAPDLREIGAGGYDHVDLSLEIDDINKPYLSFINPITGSTHFNLTWPNVPNLGTFLFSFFLMSTQKAAYPFIHIIFDAETYTGGAATPDTHTYHYALKF